MNPPGHLQILKETLNEFKTETVKVDYRALLKLEEALQVLKNNANGIDNLKDFEEGNLFYDGKMTVNRNQMKKMITRYEELLRKNG